jgi:mRNA interferase MazF
MEKNFDEWNLRKKSIHETSFRPFYRSREIWWCYFGINVGHEQDGKGARFVRPVLILKGFNRDTFLGVALIGRRKEGNFYFPLGIVIDRDSSVNLSQIRLMDTKRLRNRIAILDSDTFDRIKTIIKNKIIS